MVALAPPRSKRVSARVASLTEQEGRTGIRHPPRATASHGHASLSRGFTRQLPGIRSSDEPPIRDVGSYSRVQEAGEGGGLPSAFLLPFTQSGLFIERVGLLDLRIDGLCGRCVADVRGRPLNNSPRLVWGGSDISSPRSRSAIGPAPSSPVRSAVGARVCSDAELWSFTKVEGSEPCARCATARAQTLQRWTLNDLAVHISSTPEGRPNEQSPRVRHLFIAAFTPLLFGIAWWAARREEER